MLQLPSRAVRPLVFLTSLVFVSATLCPPPVAAFLHSGTQPRFQYDDLNRLTAASGSYGTFSYAYDPLGKPGPC
jgi:hypothetical protein